jgi:hypothetical protein
MIAATIGPSRLVQPTAGVFRIGTKVGLIDQVHDGFSFGGLQARLIQLRTTKPGQAFAAWSL